jgi:hypothetical protein
LPFVVFGVERVLRLVFADEPHVDRGLAADGAASAVVCSFVFAASAVANFSPSRRVGYVRAIFAMSLCAFVALFMAVVVWIFAFPVDHGNPKAATSFLVWFCLEYQYLLIFPLTFLPGAVAFTCWRISTTTESAANAASLGSPIIARQTSRPLNAVELLLCVSLLLALMTFLRPVFSQSRAQLLAEGVVLWHGQPVGGATVAFYPVLNAGRLGTPAHQEDRPATQSDGRFRILTWPEWRKTNPSKGEFAVTVTPATDDGRSPISAQVSEAIRPFALSESTPIRVTILARNRSGLRIELSEWCSRRDSR